MNIVIANQKGGAGKTTHCILFANYLSIFKKQGVVVLDMDFQSTIKSIYDEDRKNFDNEPLYEVIDIDLSESAFIMDKIKHVEGHVIIDLPGKMDDENLIPVFKNVDLVICPFAYDRKTYTATHVFAQVVKVLNSKVPIVFLPNRLKAGVKYLNKAQCIDELSDFGVIAPEISDKIAFQRVDTLTISDEILGQVTTAYDFIYNNYFKEKK